LQPFQGKEPPRHPEYINEQSRQFHKRVVPDSVSHVPSSPDVRWPYCPTQTTLIPADTCHYLDSFQRNDTARAPPPTGEWCSYASEAAEKARSATVQVRR